MAHRTRGALIGALVLLPASLLPASAARADTAVSESGLTGVAEVSHDGRWALGGSAAVGSAVIRDLRSGAESPVDLGSFEGFVRDNPALHLTRSWLGSTRAAHVVRTATGDTRRVDTTSKDQPLVPGWAPVACGTTCAWYQRPTVVLSRSSVSRNGRIVAFCANYSVPARPDLFVKDLRTGRLARTGLTCGIDRVDFPRDPELSTVHPPEVSEDGDVVHLRGDSYVSSQGWALTNWAPSQLYFPRKGKRLQLDGWGSMTRDGSTVFMRVGTVALGAPDATGGQMGAYAVATGKVRPLAGDGLIHGNHPYWFSAFDQASRTGRYVVGPTGVMDRKLDVTVDLDAALAAGGQQAYTGSDCPACGGAAGMRRISGDGRVVVVPVGVPGKPRNGLPIWTDRRDIVVTGWHPAAAVQVAAVRKGTALRVDVDPDKPRRAWTFRVQRLKHGSWRTLDGTYRTRGAADRRTLKLPRGTYRVRVMADFGFAGTTSAAVRVTG